MMKKDLDKKKLIEVARIYYSPLPYHNFEHAKKVAEEAEDAARRFSDEVSPLTHEDFYIAGLFHDAVYAEDHKSKGFDTKEQYSAHIAEEELSKLGVKEGVIANVRKLVIATEPDSGDLEFASSLMRIIDFNSFASSSFLEDNKKVREETEMFGKKLGDEDFYERVERTAGKYLKRDKKVADMIFGPDYNWKGRVEGNLQALKERLVI